MRISAYIVGFEAPILDDDALTLLNLVLSNCDATAPQIPPGTRIVVYARADGRTVSEVIEVPAA